MLSCMVNHKSKVGVIEKDDKIRPGNDSAVRRPGKIARRTRSLDDSSFAEMIDDFPFPCFSILLQHKVAAHH